MAFHKQYEQTPIDYPTVVGILTPILAASLRVFHSHLDQDRLCAVMDAPIVEVLTLFSDAADFSDAARPVLEAVCGSAGAACAGFVDGPVIEAIAQNPEIEGARGPAHFVAVGWESVGARTGALAGRGGSWAAAIPNSGRGRGGVQVPGVTGDIGFFVRFSRFCAKTAVRWWLVFW
jgi:hypothetical protein